MKKIIISIAILTMASKIMIAQSVGIGTPIPDSSAILELSSTNKGFLPPRMTVAQMNAIVSPKPGLIIYLTDSIPGLYIYNVTGYNAAGSGNFVDLSTSQSINGSKAFLSDIYANGIRLGKGKGIIATNTAIGFEALNTDTINKANDSSTILGGRNTALGYQSLYSNSSGSRNTSNGHQSLFSNTNGSSNTANGVSSLYYNTIGRGNAANGDNSLYNNTTGSDNTSNGSASLYSNRTGSLNTSNGYQSLFNNTDGNSNVANGGYALLNNTTGYNNTANGVSALNWNSTGKRNTANGFSSLFSNTTGEYNTADGVFALRLNTTGDHNTATGDSALFSNTTGYQNTATGAFALMSNTLGNYNTALGYAAFFTGNIYSNSTALGYSANITASNQIRLGNSSITSIGGQVGWTTISDGRFKKDIKETVPGLPFILELRPVTYHLDMDAIAKFHHNPDSLRSKKSEAIKSAVLQTGFIAQEVERVANHIGYNFSGVDKPRNENDIYGLRYDEFVVPLVKGMQEQQKMILELQKLILKLEEKIKALEDK